MRLAWTDDFGYAGMYALAESPRVIEHVRAAALGFTDLGADRRGDRAGLGGLLALVPGDVPGVR